VESIRLSLGDLPGLRSQVHVLAPRLQPQDDRPAGVGRCRAAGEARRFRRGRRANWAFFRKALADLGDRFVLPEATAGSDPCWFGFLLTFVETRRSPAMTSCGIWRPEDPDAHAVRGHVVRQPAFVQLARDRARQGAPRPSASRPPLKTPTRSCSVGMVGVYPGITEAMREHGRRRDPGRREKVRVSGAGEARAPQEPRAAASQMNGAWSEQAARPAPTSTAPARRQPPVPALPPEARVSRSAGSARRAGDIGPAPARDGRATAVARDRTRPAGPVGAAAPPHSGGIPTPRPGTAAATRPQAAASSITRAAAQASRESPREAPWLRKEQREGRDRSQPEEPPVRCQLQRTRDRDDAACVREDRAAQPHEGRDAEGHQHRPDRRDLHELLRQRRMEGELQQEQQQAKTPRSGEQARAARAGRAGAGGAARPAEIGRKWPGPSGAPTRRQARDQVYANGRPIAIHDVREVRRQGSERLDSRQRPDPRPSKGAYSWAHSEAAHCVRKQVTRVLLASDSRERPAVWRLAIGVGAALCSALRGAERRDSRPLAAHARSRNARADRPRRREVSASAPGCCGPRVRSLRRPGDRVSGASRAAPTLAASLRVRRGIAIGRRVRYTWSAFLASRRAEGPGHLPPISSVALLAGAGLGLLGRPELLADRGVFGLLLFCCSYLPCDAGAVLGGDRADLDGAGGLRIATPCGCGSASSPDAGGGRRGRVSLELAAYRWFFGLAAGRASHRCSFSEPGGFSRRFAPLPAGRRG